MSIAKTRLEPKQAEPKHGLVGARLKSIMVSSSSFNLTRDCLRVIDKMNMIV